MKKKERNRYIDLYRSILSIINAFVPELFELPPPPTPPYEETAECGMAGKEIIIIIIISVCQNLKEN